MSKKGELAEMQKNPRDHSSPEHMHNIYDCECVSMNSEAGTGIHVQI